MRAHLANATARTVVWREGLLNLLFPPRCAACGRPGTAFCPSCLSQVLPVTPPYCPRCGGPLDEAPCSACREFSLHIDLIRSAALFEGVVREAIHALKYRGRRDVARPLSGLLVDCARSHPLQFDMITAVPLHESRERERGYNQSELLARELAAAVGRPYRNILFRSRATADQIGLNINERHANVRDAFAAETGVFAGQRVLLIDDVCTTGATLDACAVALRTEGAKRVYGLTVARPGLARSSPMVSGT